jgi:NTE family protein
MTTAPRIALVLGAGGITGFAYHSGVLSSLSRLTGWDARTADIIVGTSAGSGFGAMLRGDVPVDDVLAHLLAAPSNPETMARLRVLSGREPSSPGWLWFGPASPRLLLSEMRRPWRVRPSRLAVSLLPSGRIPTDFLGDRVRELHGLDWPDAPLLVCAVRLRDGERVVFGADDVAADVGTAVEASSAIPAFFRPVQIGGERYVDGAVHSPTNADLLAGSELDLVVVSSPMSASCRSAVRSLDGVSRLSSAASLRREVDELRRSGCEVLVLEPGPDEVATMGPIAMDPTRMVPTILQASSSVLERLASPKYAGPLALLGRAAAAITSPPDVPYPDSTTKRAS